MKIGEFFTLLGYLTGALVFYLAARGKKLATEGIGYVALAGLCGGVIGARIGALLSTPGAAALLPNGKALMGGLIGGWLAVELCKKRLGITRSTGDLWALALPAGEAIGRLGCYFNGCCFGTTCDWPWAVYQHGAWRHPAQLYAAVMAALIFAVLLWLRPQLGREGELFRAWLLLFAMGRFVFEFLRERPSLFYGFSLAQWLCLEVVIGAAFWWLWMRKISHKMNKTMEI